MLMKRILLIICFFSLVQVLHAQDVTRIWIVRHGEKAQADPGDKNPALSAAGQERAAALAAYLKNTPVDALFSTDYKRTRETLTPLAQEKKLEIQAYSSKDYQLIAERVLKEYKGKQVVICGHSNTILNIVAAFGAVKPFDEIPDQDYQHIFLVEVKENQASVKAQTYGKL